MKIIWPVIASLALSVALGSTGAVAATAPATSCVARDTQNLTPTTRAPAWYVPGVTGPCQAERSEGSVDRCFARGSA